MRVEVVTKGSNTHASNQIINNITQHRLLQHKKKCRPPREEDDFVKIIELLYYTIKFNYKIATGIVLLNGE